MDEGREQSDEESQELTDIEHVSDPVKSIPFALWSRASLICLVLFFAAGSIGYRLLVGVQLEQTAALFIGLPTLLAIIVILCPPAKTATGGILRATTIALLMSGPLLGEGFICILMASPLFYGVGIIVGLVEDYSRRRASERNKLRVVVWLPLLIMSFEGVSEKLSFPRNETVSVTRIVDGTVAECEAHLAQTPQFPEELPFYLKLGFPKPKETSGKGLEPGSTRAIYFAGGEGKPGTLTMKVSERRPGFVRFEAVSDTSHIAHWLDWRDAAVTMKPTGNDRTEVTWSLRYVRRLDPAWYFKPWQRYGAKLAAEYLIDNLVASKRARRVEVADFPARME